MEFLVQSAVRVPDGRHESEVKARVKPAFFNRPVVEVARDLIGCVVRRDGCAGVIVECEAYDHSEPASHAFVGLTPRTATLFGPPGRAYLYRSYGVHVLLNAVCEPEGVGAGVLIRALEPTQGIELMRRATRVRVCPRAVLGAGQADPGARDRAERRRRRSRSRPDRYPAASRGLVGRSGVRRSADRDHQGDRAAVAILRDGQPLPVATGAPGRVGANRRLRYQVNSQLPAPRLTKVYRLEASLGQPLDLGEIAQGHRRVVPLTGGTFTGPEINGTLLSGASADWQIVLPDGTALGDIRYTLQTEGGDLLYVQSRSIRHGSQEVLARLARGEDVEASEYTFRASTQIETGGADLDWLDKGVFISVGGRQPGGVIYETYLVG